MPNTNKKLTSYNSPQWKKWRPIQPLINAHAAVLIVLSFPSHLSQRWPNIKSYDACCDSVVLGQFRQAPAHLHKCTRLRCVPELIPRII